MINLKNIQTAVADILKQNGYTVTASEVEQGFSKPTFFVDVLPVSMQVQNRYTELVTVSVELTYHPLIETRERLVEVSESIKICSCIIPFLYVTGFCPLMKYSLTQINQPLSHTLKLSLCKKQI